MAILAVGVVRQIQKSEVYDDHFQLNIFGSTTYEGTRVDADFYGRHEPIDVSAEDLNTHAEADFKDALIANGAIIGELDDVRVIFTLK